MRLLEGIQAKCQGALRDLKQAAVRSEYATEDASPVVVREALKQAVARLTPRIREMMKAKYRASGLKVGKGNKDGEHLIDQIGRMSVALKWRGSKPVLVVEMPSGLDNNDYAKAAALNYGAVRQPQIERVLVDIPSNNEKAKFQKAGIIGERAKRTLKRQVLGKETPSQNADTWRAGRTNRARMHEAFYDSRRARQIKSGSFQVTAMAVVRSHVVKGGELYQHNASVNGNISIIPPRPFFTFTATERQQIADMIEQEVMSDLKRS